MIRQDFLKFDSTSDLHKELTNILLLATGDSNFFYCYCVKVAEGRKYDLCDLCHFLFDDDNLMDGLSPKKFLQLNLITETNLMTLLTKSFHFLKEWNVTTNVPLTFLIENLSGS